MSEIRDCASFSGLYARQFGTTIYGNLPTNRVVSNEFGVRPVGCPKSLLGRSDVLGLFSSEWPCVVGRLVGDGWKVVGSWSEVVARWSRGGPEVVPGWSEGGRKLVGGGRFRLQSGSKGVVLFELHVFPSLGHAVQFPMAFAFSARFIAYLISRPPGYASPPSQSGCLIGLSIPYEQLRNGHQLQQEGPSLIWLLPVLGQPFLAASNPKRKPPVLGVIWIESNPRLGTAFQLTPDIRQVSCTS